MSGPWQPPVVGIDVIKSPFVPEGTFYLIGQSSPLWDWNGNLPLESPVSELVGEPPDHFSDYAKQAWRDVMSNGIRLADEHCNHWGLDPETTWRASARRTVLEARWFRNQVALALEARVAMTITRPESFVVASFS